MTRTGDDPDSPGGDPEKPNLPEKRRPRYTCKEYQAEMRLLALMTQLEKPNLTPQQRKILEKEIGQIERQLEME